MSKIMIVDDEANVAKSVKRLLEANDFDVVVAEDGKSALQMLRNETEVSVVVSDQRMPKMTGSELFSQLSVERPDIKRILLTGYTDLDSIRDAVNKGNIFRFLLKPWDDDELLACVEEGEHVFMVQQENKRLRKELELSNTNLEYAVEQKTRVLNMNIRSLERYEKIVENLPVGVICVSDDGMVVLANQHFCHEFGFENAVEGMSFKRVLPSDFHPLIENYKAGAVNKICHENRWLTVTSKSLELDKTIYGMLFSFQSLDYANENQ
ncbi:response regulator [Reinekea sp. G2M2-21]|uniref:response regulator n=1 Tax=Reinekea sp. G2M2-21 TaxID=2788942 RepID=UPI0018AA8991|nr:response regulator [Reinekea sp. G2M2-21]